MLSLKRWQKHSESQHRALPTTASMSSQVAWLAGTTLIGDRSATTTSPYFGRPNLGMVPWPM